MTEDADELHVLMAFSITPLGGSASVGDAVARAVRIVRASGLANETNAMFTNVEGPWSEVMAVLRACADELIGVSPRVSLVAKMDIRPGAVDALHEKVATVERLLAEARAPDAAQGPSAATE